MGSLYNKKLDRYWTDIGQIMDRYWIDTGQNLDNLRMNYNWKREDMIDIRKCIILAPVME